jgi:hypothetical protein
MQKALVVLATAASMGLAITTSIAIDFRPNGRMAAEVGRALVAGVILGSGVWPYNLKPNPPEIETRLMTFANCNWQAHCDSYEID